MKKIIDINQWDRRESFEFFEDFYNPSISVTCQVKCRQAKSVDNIEIVHNKTLMIRRYFALMTIFLICIYY